MFNMKGLSDTEVKEARRKYGSNKIVGENKTTFFSLFIETLGDPIIKILLIALAIKTIFLFRDFDYFETIGIVIAVLVASLISAISEYGSNKAFQRMQEESSRIRVRVKRNNNVIEIPIDEVVVGDIILLSSGDKVSADSIIIKGNLSVDESSLNGESKEVYKREVSDIKDASNINKVYRGTTIYDGEALCLVYKVGMDTMYGKMAKVLTEEEEESVLKLRLTHLAKIISTIGYVSAILIGLLYLVSKIFISNSFDMELIRNTMSFNKFLSYLLEAMTISVSVLVMSVPEGLPMMITLVLSTNSKKMLKDNVLVRKMVGIETAGSLNILFTDKTGTITKGKMEVVELFNPSFDKYNDIDKLPNKYRNIIIDSILYNNEGIYNKNDNNVVGGNITEKALLNFIKKEKDDNIKVVDKLLFNSKNKYSTSVILKNNKKIKLIKGSYDKIINSSSYYMDESGNKKILDKKVVEDYVKYKTSMGLRCIALAVSSSIYPVESIRRNTLIGLIFIKDDVREEAKDAIELIKSSGVNIVMVTGDSKETATSIAKEVGIVEKNSDIVLTSNELSRMDDRELKEIIPNLKVVARALPEDKKRLVELSKSISLVTGMTGDGVNDSIALKKSDVSFAMGSGTEVAKEASDIVITDDNIISIAKAILYGRTIFKNIRKFIIFQLSINLAAVSLSLIGPFIGIETPITVIQMLWINMVMDTLAGLAFSYEVPRREYMMEPPKKKNEKILNSYMINEIVLSGLYILILSLLFLKLPLINNIFSNVEHKMTAFFTMFIFLSVFNSFNARTHRINIFAHLKDNKMFIVIILFIVIIQVLIIYSGTSLFQTTSISIKEFILVLILSFTIIPFDILRKILIKKNNKII